MFEPSKKLLPSKEELFRFAVVLIIAVLVAVSTNFLISLTSDQSKPFCDSNGDSWDWSPGSCESCPDNGRCFEGKLECNQGYMKHGNMCLEDGDINEAAKKLSEIVELQVCETCAQHLCSGKGVVWVHLDEVLDDSTELDIVKSFRIDSVGYIYATKRAEERISRLLEMRTGLEGIKELKCPDALVKYYKPFLCRFAEWISAHALPLIISSVLLVGCTFFLIRVHRQHNLSIEAEQLYEQICDILEEHALMSKDVRGGAPWVVAPWLRDHLLSPKERRNLALWKKVEELVREDSRIDRYPKLVKGEPKVVWEWQVEGSLSSSRRHKRDDGTSKSGKSIKEKIFRKLSIIKGET